MDRRDLKTPGTRLPLKGSCCFSKILEQTAHLPLTSFQFPLFISSALFLSQNTETSFSVFLVLLYFFLVSTYGLGNTYHTFYWKLSQDRWQNLGLKIGKTDDSASVWLCLLFVMLPTRPAKRQCKEHTKSRICRRVHLPAPVSSSQRCTPNSKFSTACTEWGNQQVSGDQNHLQASWSLYLLFGWWWPHHHSSPPYNHVSFCATVTSTKLSVVFYSNIRSPSGSRTDPDLLTKSTEKLNFTYKTFFKKSNSFVYCRFPNMSTLSLFNKQINWRDSLKSQFTGVKHEAQAEGNHWWKLLKKNSQEYSILLAFAALTLFYNYKFSENNVLMACLLRKWCVRKLKNIVYVIGWTIIEHYYEQCSCNIMQWRNSFKFCFEGSFCETIILGQSKVRLY